MKTKKNIFNQSNSIINQYTFVEEWSDDFIDVPPYDPDEGTFNF